MKAKTLRAAGDRIVAPEGNYDQNKYFTDDTQYLVPAGLPPPAGKKRHPGLVVKAYRVLDCRGWGVST